LLFVYVSIFIFFLGLRYTVILGDGGIKEEYFWNNDIE